MTDRETIDRVLDPAALQSGGNLYLLTLQEYTERARQRSIDLDAYTRAKQAPPTFRENMAAGLRNLADWIEGV